MEVSRESGRCTRDQTNVLSKQKVNKRQRNTDEQATKRRKLEDGEEGVLPIYATKFSEDVLQAEERRPKKKVAVLIGYAGTGYHGMQLSVRLIKNSQQSH
jgi:tRNA pseudouridine38-40 synthase